MPSAEQRARTDEGLVTRSCKAMASQVTIRLHDHDRSRQFLAASAERALQVFPAVERACTRFDPSSPLMLLNAEPARWRGVPPVCYDAVREAFLAYQRTGGVFDPRVLGDLVRLGYDRSLDGQSASPRGHEALAGRSALPPWEPRFRPETHEVHLGGHPVDLGGIGKGLAVRWAAEELRGAAAGHLVEAGGDCACAGQPPDADAWRIAVEDPLSDADDDPVAVLSVRDGAVATSSTRVHRWRAGGSVVHHLVDPRDGRPGGAGLASVTVVAEDPADAEVTTKVLFLAGARNIADTAERLTRAALWVGVDGSVGTSAALDPFLLWRR